MDLWPPRSWRRRYRNPEVCWFLTCGRLDGTITVHIQELRVVRDGGKLTVLHRDASGYWYETQCVWDETERGLCESVEEAHLRAALIALTSSRPVQVLPVEVVE